MPPPTAQTMHAACPPAALKRRRDFTPEERVSMHTARTAHYQRGSLRRRALAAGRAAAMLSARNARHEKHTIETARALLPPLHEAHKFITEEQSKTVVRLMVHSYDLLCPDPKWLSRSIPAVAHTSGISDDLVREIWKYFDETGEFYVTDRPVPPRSAFAVELDSKVRDFLEEQLPRDALSGVLYTTHSLQLLLNETFQVGFSSYYVKHVMQEMGYRFGKAGQDWTVGMKSPRRQRQLLYHLLVLNQALSEVKAGKAVLLFTDQTFIDTRTHSRYGYIHPEKTHAHFPKGTGLRVAHMHALTAHGLLAVTGPDGKPVIPPSSDDIRGERASTAADTAELTCSLKADTGAPEPAGPEREKKGFSAKVCADWIENRLLPAARKVWPAPMKLYLYMDNFSGHTGRDKSRYWPQGGLGHTREWNLLQLRAAGCTSLTHGGSTFTIDSLLASPKPAGGPNAKKIIELGRAWMWENCPDNAFSAVQRAAMRDANLLIIFSVPLTPDANPIEYWWGTCKGGLSRLWDGDVDPAVIISRWRSIALDQGMAMEGVDALGGSPALNPLCQSYVDTAIRWADEFLVPMSVLADCGKLGSFDFSKVPDIAKLARELSESPRIYYRVWRECENLSLVPPGPAVAGDEEEDDDD